MIVLELITYMGTSYARLHSDEKRYVVSPDGDEYSEICVPIGDIEHYTEGDIMADDEVVDPHELLDILLGEQP